jgi:hypothetical protein
VLALPGGQRELLPGLTEAMVRFDPAASAAASVDLAAGYRLPSADAG